MFLELTQRNGQRIAIRACDIVCIEEDVENEHNDDTGETVVTAVTRITYNLNGRSDTEYVTEDYQQVMSKLR